MRRPVVMLVTTAMVIAAFSPVLVAGATPAVSQASDGPSLERTGEPVPYQTGGRDPIALNSGSEYWAGTTLRFDGSKVVDDVSNAPAKNRTFQIWSVDSTGEADSVLSSFTVSQNGTAELSTSTLRDRVVIQYDGDPVYVTDGVGYTESPPDGTDVTVDASAWRIVSQTLDASWHDRVIFEGQVAHLDLKSNREEYVVAVSATIDGDRIAFENLTRLFSSETYASDYDARSDSDQLLVTAGASTDYRVNSSWLPAETVTFTFDVVDTTASSERNLRIESASGTPRILGTGGSRITGDELSVRVACSHCYLVLGRGAPGTPLDLLELTDADGDSVVELEINTRYAGLVPSAVPGAADTMYDAGPDTVYRYDTSDLLEDRTRATGSAYIGQVRDTIGINSAGLTDVISPGDLTVRIATSDYLISREEYGANYDPPGRPLVVVDEVDAETLFLEDRSLADLRTVPLPKTAQAATDPTTAFETTTERSAVAVGDQLLFSIDVTGIYGYLSTRADPLSALLENEEEGLDLSLRPVAGGPRVPNDAIRAATELRINESEQRIYGIVDTKTLDQEAAIETGAEYTLRFRLTGGGPRVVGDNTDGYPYIAAGRTETVETPILFQNRSITVTSPNPEDAEVKNQQKVTVSGTTTVASGTSLSLRAEAVDPYVWSTATTITVDQNREWNGTLDFSEAPGSEFTVDVIDGNEQRASFQLELVTETATPTQTSDGTGATATATATATPAANDTAGTETATATSRDGDGTEPTETSADQSPAGNQTTTATATEASGGGGTQTNDGAAAPQDGDSGGGLFGILPAGLPIVEVGGVLVGLVVVLVVLSRIRGE